MAGYRRSRLKGAKSTRRLIRNIEPEMRAEMVHVMSDSGPKIARAMQARTPRRTGALQAGITWKVFPKLLKLQVGLLGTKRGRAKLFYGYILNFGRKAKTVTIKHGPRAGGEMHIPALAGLKFVTGSYKDLRVDLTNRLRGAWDRVLQRASAGAGDD